MKKLVLSLGMIFLLCSQAFPQLSVTSPGTNYTIDFENTQSGVNNGQFAGTGFDPGPATGRLDSDAWASTGMSDGATNYGGTYTTGDWARGSNVGGTATAGGFYSFQVATGDYTLGIQPSGADFTPGELFLRIQNNTGSTLDSIFLSFNVCYYNDQGYGTSFNFAYSTDGSAYTSIPALNFSSPTTAATPPVTWATVARSTGISSLSISPGAYFYFRWSSDDAGGSGSRDEISVDDIVVNVHTPSGVANPPAFAATPYSTVRNDLTWSLNGSGDSVLIAWNSVNTFGTPSGVYAVGGPFPGGGTVLYKGTGTSTSHSGLTPDTEYYYKAFSMTAIHQYSTGVVDSATTYKVAPSDYPSGFVVTATGITITADWTDAEGSQPPDGYLVRISDADNITAPADGTPVSDDRDLTDGSGAINVAQGVESFTFFRLAGETRYYLKIYPYTNSGAGIDYKTDETPPSDDATTQTLLNTVDFEDNTFGTWTSISVASNKNWNVYTGTGAYSTGHYANANAYLGDVGSNDWLISPGLNLNIYTNEKAIFFTSWNFGSFTDELTFVYSTDYVSGDPTLANWDTLPYAVASTNLTWLPSGFIDISGISGNNVHFAFHHVTTVTTSATRSWSVDEIEITGVGVADPQAFSATAVSENQIDLSWTLNSSSDNVIIAFNTTNTFGTPMPGNNYMVPGFIIGGGTVIYNGSGTSFNHTGRSANTPYYYKIWSYDGSYIYSSGLTGNATTFAQEPSSHPTGFTATSNGQTQITVAWSDCGADNYLIRGSDVSPSGITAPVDFTPVANSLLDQNVASGVQIHEFSGLTPNTEYYFKIFPYNGTGTASNYKTNGTVPLDSATTDEFNVPLLFTEISDPADSALAKFVEITNTGSTDFNLSTTAMYLSRQSNGGSWADLRLTGTIHAGESFVLAYVQTALDSLRFDFAYGMEADMYANAVSGNGDDGYFLYYNGNHSTGTLIDAYGVIGQDGTNQPWEYLDGHAVRKRGITAPNATWTASEWVIIRTCKADNMTPFAHGEDVTWQGALSGDWNERGANWNGSHGWVPDASYNVTVPVSAIYPVVTEKSACNTLNISNMTNLGIGAAGSLRIVGQVP